MVRGRRGNGKEGVTTQALLTTGREAAWGVTSACAPLIKSPSRFFFSPLTFACNDPAIRQISFRLL
uniref:Uncharacterized protein n=1 Tax=Otus sunia TaxID=257818 RepID=A0A8C8E826_9STRI